MSKKLNIPEHWTFKNKSVADNFDKHVREQLPWYDLATKAVVHFARHYVPVNGVVYDIGASTGNISLAISDACIDRYPRVIAVEESNQMVEILKSRLDVGLDNKIELALEDALKFDFKQYDFAVCFLTMMFFPVVGRKEWLMKMRSLIKPGGALVVVDKIVTPPGYAGTALRRMAMQWKLDTGTSPEDIVKKELSLAGYQRPLDPRMFDGIGQQFFAMGEFAGWVIERNGE